MNNYQRIKLSYELNDLEPIINFKTMYYHYSILHKNYEIKLNDILRESGLQEKPLTRLRCLVIRGRISHMLFDA